MFNLYLTLLVCAVMGLMIYAWMNKAMSNAPNTNASPFSLSQ